MIIEPQLNQSVLAGEKVPFEDSADRLRDIVGRFYGEDEQAISPAGTQPPETEALNAERGGYAGELDRAYEVLFKADHKLTIIHSKLTNMRGFANDLLTADEASALFRESQEYFRGERSTLGAGAQRFGLIAEQRDLIRQLMSAETADNA